MIDIPDRRADRQRPTLEQMQNDPNVRCDRGKGDSMEFAAAQNSCDYGCSDTLCVGLDMV